MLDFEIESAERDFKRRTEFNKDLIERWNRHRDNELKNNPDKYIPELPPGLDFTPRRIVIGLRYVE